MVAAVFALAFCLAILQTFALRFTLYDVGIFHQIVWSVSKGFGFWSSISGAGNFLLDHFSPTLALVVPFFWLTGGAPWILPVLHAVLIFTGIAAWIRLAERVPGVSAGFRPVLVAGVTVFALSFDSLWGNLRWGFHETAISFAASSWALSFWLQERRKSISEKSVILVLLLITALSKEILLVDVALALWVWAFIEFRERAPRARIFAAFLIAVGVVLLAGFLWFESIPHPADKNYFDRYYGYLGHSLGEFFSTLFLKPWKIVENVGARELLRYLKTVFLPWLFPLGFALVRGWKTPNWLWLAMIGPSFASAALSTYPPLRGDYFHYVLELWPVLAGLTIFALARAGSTRLVWAWAFLALLSMDQDPIAQFREYGRGAVESRRVVERMKAVPPEAKVMADELSGPWLAGRRFITRAPALHFFEGCPDWMVLRGDEAIPRCQAQLAWQEGPWAAYLTRDPRAP